MADAVRLEPVSASEFPANREKNREIYKKRPQARLPLSKKVPFHWLAAKFPTRRSRELFWLNREFHPKSGAFAQRADVARFRGRVFDDGLFSLDRQQRLIDDHLLPSLGA